MYTVASPIYISSLFSITVSFSIL